VMVRRRDLPAYLIGTILGVVAGTAVNLLFVAEGPWFPAAILLPAYLPVVYFLLFRFVIGPLDEALGVEGGALGGLTPPLRCAGLMARVPPLPNDTEHARRPPARVRRRGGMQGVP